MSTDCTDCPAGKKCQSSFDTFSIEPCFPGRYSHAGSEYCESCPNGKYVDAYASTSSENCTSSACTQHHICVGGTKIPCPIGKDAPNTGSTVCSTCPNGKYSVSGSACGEICPAGHYCMEGVKYQCPHGKYSTLGSPCVNCADGTWSSDGAISCYLCSPGYFCYNGYRSACADGKYSPSGALYGHQCLSSLCPAGYYCATGSGKLLCPTGKYSSVGSSACTSCPSATYTNGGVSTSYHDCMACWPGYYCISGKINMCPPRHFSSQHGSEVCTACENGMKTNEDRTQCDQWCNPESEPECWDYDLTPGTDHTPEDDSSEKSAAAETVAAVAAVDEDAEKSEESSSTRAGSSGAILIGILGLVLGTIGSILAVIALCKLKKL